MSNEWKNGDECVFDDRSGIFIGLMKNKSLAVVEINNKDFVDYIPVSKLSKPETPEQKAERERLELVKKACLTVRHDYGLMSKSDRNFLEKSGLEWLRAFEKEKLNQQ